MTTTPPVPRPVPDPSVAPQWVRDFLTERQWTLSQRRRWIKVVLHPDLDLTATETLVLLALADRMRDEGLECFVSMTALAKATKLARPTVARTLRRVEEKGWLFREGGRARGLKAGQQNLYRGWVPRDFPGRVGAQDTQEVGAQDTYQEDGWVHSAPRVGAQGSQVGAQDTRTRCTVHHEVGFEVRKKDGLKGAVAPVTSDEVEGQGQQQGRADQNGKVPGQVAREPGTPWPTVSEDPHGDVRYTPMDELARRRGAM